MRLVILKVNFLIDRLAIKITVKQMLIYTTTGRALYDLERFKKSAEAYSEGINIFQRTTDCIMGVGWHIQRMEMRPVRTG